MVRRGSTVRVRQRTLQKRRKSRLFLSGIFAEAPVCGGYGALYGAFSGHGPIRRKWTHSAEGLGLNKPSPASGLTARCSGSGNVERQTSRADVRETAARSGAVYLRVGPDQQHRTSAVGSSTPGRHEMTTAFGGARSSRARIASLAPPGPASRIRSPGQHRVAEAVATHDDEPHASPGFAGRLGRARAQRARRRCRPSSYGHPLIDHRWAAVGAPWNERLTSPWPTIIRLALGRCRLCGR
jgi:hypothetical protein